MNIFIVKTMRKKNQTSVIPLIIPVWKYVQPEITAYCQAQFQLQFQSNSIELNVTSSSPRKLKFGMQANFTNIR